MNGETIRTDPLRIGIVCFPMYGGSGVVATEIGFALAARGHEVHIISYAQPVRLRTFLPNLMFHEVRLYEYPLFDSPLYTIHIAATIAHLVRYTDLQIVHAHYALPHGISALLARWAVESHRFCVVTTLHGTDVTLVGQHASFAPITHLALQKSDHLTCVSEYLARTVHSNFAIPLERIEVIYNFVDTQRFVPLPPDERRRRWETEKCLIHVSNFRPVKRVIDVIRIFERVHREVPCELVLIGDGPERDRAERYVLERGLQRWVHFLGKQEDIIPPLQRATVFLLPSDQESFGLAALEAMSCGLPVVASNVGGIPEVITHGRQGFLHTVGAVEDMARDTLRLLTDEDLWIRMSEAARARALEFDATRIIPRYERMYYRVMTDA